MASNIYRVSLGFAQSTDAALVTVASQVINGMDAPAFAAKPVSTAALTARTTDYQQKLAATLNRGIAETVAKNLARAALIDDLRLNAAFVQMIAGTDLPLLLASGFRATSSNRASGPLTKPIITNVDTLQSTILMVTAEVDSRARAQETRFRVAGTEAYQSAGVQTKPSRVLFQGLIPRMTYELQIRSVGGTTGYSDWSDSVSHMAT